MGGKRSSPCRTERPAVGSAKGPMRKKSRSRGKMAGKSALQEGGRTRRGRGWAGGRSIARLTHRRLRAVTVTTANEGSGNHRRATIKLYNQMNNQIKYIHLCKLDYQTILCTPTVHSGARTKRAADRELGLFVADSAPIAAFGAGSFPAPLGQALNKLWIKKSHLKPIFLLRSLTRSTIKSLGSSRHICRRTTSS